MKKGNVFLTGILGMMLVFGLVLAGCDDSGGGGGSGGDGLTVEEARWSYSSSDSYQIKLYLTSDFTQEDLKSIKDVIEASGFDPKNQGFIVTANGTQQEVTYLGVDDGSVFINFKFPTLPTSVTISYDGTGPFAGKLAKFTNKSVTSK
jgi:hypothetical protein